MQTYKITFSLDTPCCITDLPTFDGLLAYGYAKENRKGEIFTQKLSYTKDEFIDFSKMPIESHKDGYFMASSMIFRQDEMICFTERWRKRWANRYDKLADFGKQKRKLAINRGAFKSYDMPFELKDINEVCFLFQSRNIDGVKKCLSHIYRIGKKASQGHGIIDSYNIEEYCFDFSGVFRPIPINLVGCSEQCNVCYCSWRPPYWMPENFDVCATPNFIDFYKSNK